MPYVTVYKIYFYFAIFFTEYFFGIICTYPYLAMIWPDDWSIHPYRTIIFNYMVLLLLYMYYPYFRTFINIKSHLTTFSLNWPYLSLVLHIYPNLTIFILCLGICTPIKPHLSLFCLIYVFFVIFYPVWINMHFNLSSNIYPYEVIFTLILPYLPLIALNDFIIGFLFNHTLPTSVFFCWDSTTVQNFRADSYLWSYDI